MYGSGGGRWSRRCMDLVDGIRLEEGDGAGDVWVWRMDKDWKKTMEQKMYGSGGWINNGGRRWSKRFVELEEGWGLEEGDGAGDVCIWGRSQDEWIDDEVLVPRYFSPIKSYFVLSLSRRWDSYATTRNVGILLYAPKECNSF